MPVRQAMTLLQPLLLGGMPALEPAPASNLPQLQGLVLNCITPGPSHPLHLITSNHITHLLAAIGGGL
jgi:hypothetical protein